MAQVKRVFVGSLATETNTFSPLRTDIQDFKESFYAKPGEHPETPTLCSAIFTVLREKSPALGWEVFEGTATWAEPGGVVNQQTWEQLHDQLLAELRAAMPVEIVFLGLHGAMVSQECLDCEGELLASVRGIVGKDTLIGVTFDPHSHLTQKRIDNADLITVFKEFPHTDFVDVAEDLVQLVADAAAGLTQPKISTFDCKMIEVLPTSREPMRGFVDRIKTIEQTGNILSISVIHGFMAGDVPDLGARIIVITDNAQSDGDILAKKLGLELFGFRGKTRPDFLTPKHAFDTLQLRAKPVVLADVWDNPGGGVPGDSTIILQEILSRKIQGVALASIWDPIAVRTCFSAGEGAHLKLRFGGKMSDMGGPPIDADVTVKCTVRNAVQSFGKSIVPLGDAALIDVMGVEVILNSVRSQVFSPDIFEAFGIDPSEKSLLVVKSTNHFHDAFAKIASEIIYVAVDGPYPNKPETTLYVHMKRSIWPRVENPHG
ncbi:MAG: M81 family metallopeptidase [Rhodobacteraceae bacterium]|nr:M81 family metallopeptidase [Paracoccaceae bacterium]